VSRRSLIIFLSLFIVPVLWAENPTTSQVCQSQETIDLIKSADESYLKRTDPKQAQSAFDLYSKAIISDPACTVVYIKGSKAAWWVADHSSFKQEKLVYFQKGIDWAKEAIRLSSNSAEAHFWLAGNYGSFGEVKGVLKSLSLVKPIRMELNEVLRINPSFDEGGAYRVLGAVDYKVPGFAGGNKKRAEEQLKKCLEMGPNNPFNLYYMSEYFVTASDPAKAVPFLDRLDGLHPDLEGRPDWDMMVEKGKKLRSKIRKS
jgi:tetratricopeptide (TPR) repeat protein